MGIDDFAKKLLGQIDSIEMPNLGMEITKGQALFNVKLGSKTISFKSPLSGKVAKVNNSLGENLDSLDVTPYEKNWICVVDADNLDTELQDMKIGNAAVKFYQEKIDSAQEHLKEKLMAKDKIKEEEASNVLHYGVITKLDDFEIDQFVEKYLN